MQLVANCILNLDGKLLLLQKPRRGWWVAPGGKVEPGETPYQAVMREFREETGIELINPELRGVFTVNLFEQDQLVNSWMLMTFYCERHSGRLLAESEEGKLEWVNAESALKLPMAEGDRFFFQHILSNPGLISGKFSYTQDYELLDWKPDIEAIFDSHPEELKT